MFRKLLNNYLLLRRNLRTSREMRAYLDGGSIPWSRGYLLHRNEYIKENLANSETLQLLKSGELPNNYGSGLDERVVEYPWVVSRIKKEDKLILDAGSTFNFDFVLDELDLKDKELSILTYAPEPQSFNERRISYIYSDIRKMPFRDAHFDLVVSMSTIEHIDMDNSIYGYDLFTEVKDGEKSFEYLKAISEMTRVLRPKGRLLITVPFGVYQNHGFFQQFDLEMISRAIDTLETSGKVELQYFHYTNSKWESGSEKECCNSISYNPHSGEGKGNDGAAHCRAIACIDYFKL